MGKSISGICVVCHKHFFHMSGWSIVLIWKMIMHALLLFTYSWVRCILLIRGSIKKYGVYYIFFIIVINNRIIYATILYEVSFHLIKRFFFFVSRFLKQQVLSARHTITLKTWRQKDARTVNKIIQFLYDPESVVLFTTQFKSALYHLTSNLFTFV